MTEHPDLIAELEHKTRLLYQQQRYVAILATGMGAMTVAWGLSTWGAYKALNGFEELKRKHLSLYERTMYLVNTLEQKGVNLGEFLDEFDLIALKNMEAPK